MSEDLAATGIRGSSDCEICEDVPVPVEEPADAPGSPVAAPPPPPPPPPQEVCSRINIDIKNTAIRFFLFVKLILLFTFFLRKVL